MKIINIANLINFSFQYVIKTSEYFRIDESHSLRHSMDVFQYANEIYQAELSTSPFLKDQQKIIFASAILHDMCDKKYMKEENGINRIKEEMKDHLSEEELNIVCEIITTMSYSTVKKNGYPDLGNYQLAYHIVREADLLAAYDIPRCIIYKMNNFDYSYLASVVEMKVIFENRVLQYLIDNLFVTEYSKKKAKILHNKCLNELEEIDKIYLSLQK